MDNLNKSLGKVSIGVPSKPAIFSFVPLVRKLPIGGIITEEERSGALTGKPNKNFAVSHEETTGEIMSDEEIFKAEKVFINDSEEGGAGNMIQTETTKQVKLSPNYVNLFQTKPSLSVSAQSENTPNHVAAQIASMETAVDKHGGISHQPCHDTSTLTEVSSGFFVNRESEDRTSPADSSDVFPTLASSRESILSEKSWSAMQPSSVTSPVSFSRTMSPCSSVLSGIFSPAVVTIRRHFLAPGSSLIHTPQTCFSSCESLSSSVCSQSSPPRHRPPLTRLSLLTAILRKGRLPVLSPALQRPYTPCWPVNPVTLSFCNACSAASSVASIPLELSSSRFSSSASIDSQSHVHRCVTAPLPEQPNSVGPKTQANSYTEQIRSSSAPRWEEVILSPSAKSGTLPRAPLPLFASNLQPVSLPKLQESEPPKKLQHVHIANSPERKPCSAHTLTDNNNLKNLISPSSTFNKEQETTAPQKRSHTPNSSLSKLHLLSQRLRSPTPCPPQLPQLSRSHIASPLPPSQSTSGTCDSSRSISAPPSSHRAAYCLSPSRYTPIAFAGWPSPVGTPTPTPSPAPQIRDHTPSPCLSLRSTPSPRPGSGISDCSDREGKKRKTHKIKLSYKSLAAIPTNTLLLDQQAIDEQVERNESPCDALDRGVEDTHAEMCSPAQLRQQSAELYAVIDEILANSIPESKTSRSLQASRSSTPGLQNNSSLPKSLGRETKYASICSLHPSTSVERNFMDTKKTKPGVIRPMTAIPRLTVEDEEEFRPNPFRQSDVKQTLTDSKKVEAGKCFNSISRAQMTRDEKKPARGAPFSLCDLQITEPEDQIGHPVKDASTSFTEVRMEAFETHI